MGDEGGFAYHLHEVIGRGGFGAVVRAELRGPSGFSKVVAVKLLNRDAEANPDLVQRLRDEARMLALVQHRAIVQVDRLVKLDGRWAVIMEYVPGFDLFEVVRRRGAMPLGPALECVEEVASALHVAYDAPPSVSEGEPLRLVHRDVKPANIRLTRSGAVKLLDFGIARAHFPEREARTESIRFGSMNYMSPLRLAMQDDGHAGDMYALGAVLYELVMGEPIGMSSHHQQAHLTIVGSACTKLEQAGHPEGLVDLVRRALDFDPAARPDARRFLTAARTLRTTAAPTPSLLEWVDETFPALAQVAGILDEEEISGKVLFEERSDTNPTIATSDPPRFDVGALLSPGPPDPDRTTEPQPRLPERRRAAWPAVAVAAGLVALAVVVILALQPSNPARLPVSSACQAVPMDEDRVAMEAIDRLFRGWQDLDVSLVATTIAHDFERRDGVSGTVTDRQGYLSQREAIFGRLAGVTWNGPVHDRDGYGIPTVVDGVAVQCGGTDHLRVVVRYDWTVSSKRTGRHTVETDVVDAYELGGDGLIVANLDYADLDEARAWRDGCCSPKASLEPTSHVTGK